MTGILRILLGAGLLWIGGEILVRSAGRLARAWGLSPLVIGLTVVAFGTSSPEMAAVLAAAVRGQADMALGAVVGSNIANLGLILGISALVGPVAARARFIRREVPFMVGVVVLLVPLAWNGLVSRPEAGLLLALLAVYLVVLLVGKKETPEVEAEYAGRHEAARRPTGAALLGVGAGVALLTGGAHVLIEGATVVAQAAGLPERVVGISLVALGTSLPELAACVVAASRREGDIVLGNLIGSNVFNVLAMLSAAALVRPLAFPSAAVRPDMAVMLGFSLLVVPFLLTGLRLTRREGVVLLAAYLGYLAWLYSR